MTRDEIRNEWGRILGTLRTRYAETAAHARKEGLDVPAEPTEKGYIHQAWQGLRAELSAAYQIEAGAPPTNANSRLATVLQDEHFQAIWARVDSDCAAAGIDDDGLHDAPVPTVAARMRQLTDHEKANVYPAHLAAMQIKHAGAHDTVHDQEACAAITGGRPSGFHISTR